MPFRDELEQRSTNWVADGLISEDQRAAMLDSVPLVTARPRLVPIFSLLGAALVTLGVILVVSQNWDEIPRTTKLVSGIVLLVATYTTGYWLRFGPPQRSRTGEGVLLAGGGVFFANLALISQQYNIDFNPSPLLLPVVVVSALLAYILISRPYIFVAAVFAVFWVIFESQRDGSSIETRTTAAITLIAGSGAWLLIAAELNRRAGWARFAAPLQIAGAIAIFAAVYSLGFYRHFDVDTTIEALPGVTLVLVPFVLAAAGLAAVVLTREHSLGWPSIEAGQRWPVAVAALMVTLLMAWSFIVATNPRGDSEDGFALYTVGFWLIAVGITGSVVWLGLALKREWWINAALAYAGLFVLTRYFDLFSDYSQTGLLFAGAGLLFLALAYLLERGRRALRDEITEGGAA